MIEENRIICVHFISNGCSDRSVSRIDMGLLANSADPICQKFYQHLDNQLKNAIVGYDGTKLGDLDNQMFDDWFFKRTDNKAVLSLPCKVTDEIELYYGN